MTNYELDARFVYGPRHSHFPPKELKVVEKILRSGITAKEEPRIRELMSHFPHLNAFQNALGNLYGVDAFDPRIQEAYWIGNGFLEESGRNAGRALFNSYKKEYLPKEYLKEIEKVSEEGVILHHNFQVTKIAVIDSGGLEKSLDAVNNCMIRSARVTEVSNDTVDVSALKLCKSERGYEMKKHDMVVGYDRSLVGVLNTGNHVALHWGHVSMCISESQNSELNYWTEKIVKKL